MNLNQENLQEIAPSVARRRGDAVLSGIAKERAREEREALKRKESKKYRKLQKGTLEYKKERLRWQQERSLKKDKERREAARKSEFGGKFQQISSKDSDTAAVQKTAENIGSAVSGLASSGASAIKRKIEARKEKKAQQKAETEAQAKEAAKKASKKARKAGLADIKAKISQKALPPARTLGQSARANKDLRQQEIQKRMPIKKPKYNFKNSEFDKPTNEEYCFWREEFLYELGDIRRDLKSKSKEKDEKIDVMSGKNEITINPKVTERYEYLQMYLDDLLEYSTSSISMSRVTPPITGIVMSSSSKKAKQPGKYSTEVVRDELKKMFLGKSNYELSSDLNNLDADDNDVPGNSQYEPKGKDANEAYDPEHETFRQHSRENFSSGPSDSKKAKRTSNVLKLMAQMNADVEPPKKKKKKKKKIHESVEAETRYCPACRKKEKRSECSYGPEVWDKISIRDNINEATKREKVANAFLATTLALSAAQSPKDFVRTGHIESPGAALMQTWGRKRGEAERNLDSGRVSHPARNVKKKKKIVNESKRDSIKKWWNTGRNERVPNENEASWKELMHDDLKQLTKSDKAFKSGSKGISGWRPHKAFSPKMLKTGPTPAVRQMVERPVRQLSKLTQRKKSIDENAKIDKETLFKLILKKLEDKKKNKNYLLNYGYIGEATVDKSSMKCNKPKAQAVGDSLTGKSHVVKACENGAEKIIRFGQRGVKGSPKKKGESEAYASRRHRFQSRHARNIKKGKMSAAYWANKVKW